MQGCGDSVADMLTKYFCTIHKQISVKVPSPEQRPRQCNSRLKSVIGTSYLVTMSFGVGVGDVISVCKLAGTVRARFVDSPDQFKAISTESV